MRTSMFASQVLDYNMYHHNALSYMDYRNLIDKLVLRSKTTGNDQTEARIQYTKLNVERMTRLDRTIKLDEETVDVLNNVDQITWLVISEAWCGDGAQILPILNKMACSSNGKINLRMVLRDENPELMKLFLTNNTRSVPKLIMLNTYTFEVLGTWGPRPYTASEIAWHWKNNMDKVSWLDFQKELHLWYTQDKGKTTIQEVTDLLRSLTN